MSEKAAAAFHPNTSPFLGPDCQANKHPACDGQALNTITDEVGPCGCHCHCHQETTAGLRTRLAEIQEVCAQHALGMDFGGQINDGEAEASDALETCVTALTAVLDVLATVDDEGEITTVADGVHIPVYLVRTAITEALSG